MLDKEKLFPEDSDLKHMYEATKIEKHHASIEEQLHDSLKHLSSRIDNIV